MFSRHRLAVLFVLTLGAIIVFVATGLPRAQLSTVLAESSPYSNDEHVSKDGPGQTNDGFTVSDLPQGTITTDTAIFWEPNEGSTIGALTVTAGQTFFIKQTDSTGQWVQIVIGNTLVWIPASAIH